MVYIKTYIFNHFYEQYLVLFNMVPRNNTTRDRSITAIVSHTQLATMSFDETLDPNADFLFLLLYIGMSYACTKYHSGCATTVVGARRQRLLQAGTARRVDWPSR